MINSLFCLIAAGVFILLMIAYRANFLPRQWRNQLQRRTAASIKCRLGVLRTNSHNQRRLAIEGKLDDLLEDADIHLLPEATGVLPSRSVEDATAAAAAHGHALSSASGVGIVGDGSGHISKKYLTMNSSVGESNN